MEKLSSLFVTMSEDIVATAEIITKTGVKNTDALHIACAIAGQGLRPFYPQLHQAGSRYLQAGDSAVDNDFKN